MAAPSDAGRAHRAALTLPLYVEKRAQGKPASAPAVLPSSSPHPELPIAARLSWW